MWVLRRGLCGTAYIRTIENGMDAELMTPFSDRQRPLHGCWIRQRLFAAKSSQGSTTSTGTSRTRSNARTLCFSANGAIKRKHFIHLPDERTHAGRHRRPYETHRHIDTQSESCTGPEEHGYHVCLPWCGAVMRWDQFGSVVGGHCGTCYTCDAPHRTWSSFMVPINYIPTYTNIWYTSYVFVHIGVLFL